METSEIKGNGYKEKGDEVQNRSNPESVRGSVIVLEHKDVLSKECIDPALDARIRLVNAAIDEIGMTPFQWKMFFLTGFGYFVQNMLLVAQSVITGQAALELLPENPETRSLIIAQGVGAVIGTIAWGLAGDIIGRRWAFNSSLLICAISALISGAAPNWIALATFVAFGGLGIGGCLAIDATTLVEFVPRKQQWLVILLGVFWGLGQLVTGFFAWGFIPNFSCDPDIETCSYKNNKGWRYVWFAIGGTAFVLSVLRVTVVRMNESPKYLIGEGKDAEAVQNLQNIAKRYKKTCSLTKDQLAACGILRQTGFTTHAKSKLSLSELWVHLKGLYSSKRIGFSSTLIFFSTALQGLGYGMFFFFIPTYLEARGKDFSTDSAYITWRNYVLTGLSVTLAAFPTSYLAETRLGRKYTMAASTLVTLAFYLAYIKVNTQEQNLAYQCVISFSIACYINTMYAYTVEVLPSAHRATGAGIANALGNFMVMMSGVIGGAADPSTPTPLYICAGLWFIVTCFCIALPFETRGMSNS